MGRGGSRVPTSRRWGMPSPTPPRCTAWADRSSSAMAWAAAASPVPLLARPCRACCLLMPRAGVGGCLRRAARIGLGGML
eukprot:15477170-Alexandrium_andersonii.AAC.1